MNLKARTKHYYQGVIFPGFYPVVRLLQASTFTILGGGAACLHQANGYLGTKLIREADTTGLPV